MASLILPAAPRPPETPAAFAIEASRGRWRFAPHLVLIDHALVQIARGELRRLIVELPPRHGKSELIGRYFPAWYLGVLPDRRLIYTSYEARQARKYGRLARNLLLAHGLDWFGARVAADSSAADLWSLSGREGGMTTTGVGGPLTGKGAHVLIVDDPTKNSEQALSPRRRDWLWDWWESTALTRLEPGGAVILVQTRWHRDDLAGRARREQRGEDWRVLRMPALAEPGDLLGRPEGAALWPERFDAESLERIRANRGSYWWLALYQQRPTQHEAKEWPAEYFTGPDFWFDAWPNLLLRVAALDPAQGKRAEGDYSALALVGEDAAGHLWVEAHLARLSTGKLVEEVVERCRRFRPLYLGIESNAWQHLLGERFLPALEAAGLYDVTPIFFDQRQNKQLRIRRLDRWLGAGRLHVRRNAGGKLLVSQLQEFPLGLHDDGPDALELATQLLSLHHAEPTAEGTRLERVRA